MDEVKLNFNKETTNTWIDFKEWNFLMAFKHYKECMAWTFGFARKISNEDKIIFNDSYRKQYSENAKILEI